MNIIAVDIGNSATKISTAAEESLLNITGDDDPSLPAIADATHHWVIVSVDAEKTQKLIDRIRLLNPVSKISIIGNEQIPIATSVQQRSSVGTDRLMAAYAATHLNQTTGEAIVIVDAGTAVTIDLVTPAQPSDQTKDRFNNQFNNQFNDRFADRFADRKSVFRGGLIFPGIATNLKSLSDNTAALPDLTHSVLPSAGTEITIGDDTVSAILNGVVQSQSHAITSIAGAIAAQHDAVVICTGGGMNSMQSLIPDHWQWIPDLIHQGCRQLIDPT